MVSYEAGAFIQGSIGGVIQDVVFQRVLPGCGFLNFHSHITLFPSLSTTFSIPPNTSFACPSSPFSQGVRPATRSRRSPSVSGDTSYGNTTSRLLPLPQGPLLNGRRLPAVPLVVTRPTLAPRVLPGLYRRLGSQQAPKSAVLWRSSETASSRPRTIEDLHDEERIAPIASLDIRKASDRAYMLYGLLPAYYSRQGQLSLFGDDNGQPYIIDSTMYVPQAVFKWPAGAPTTRSGSRSRIRTFHCGFTALRVGLSAIPCIIGFRFLTGRVWPPYY